SISRIAGMVRFIYDPATGTLVPDGPLRLMAYIYHQGPREKSTDCCRTALPRRRPGFGGAWLQSRDDIDHDRSVGGDCLLEGRGELARLLDTDAAHAEAAGDRGKISRPEADQGLAAVHTIARNPVHAGQVLAEAGIVVDDDHNRDVVAARRLQFGKVIVVATIAGKTDHFAVTGGAFGAEGGRKGPA